MLQTQALQRNFDGEDIINEEGLSVREVLSVPSRNWSALIDSYNETNKRRFPLTPLQCKIIVEYAKKSTPVQHSFEAFGFSSYKYGAFIKKYNQAESRFTELQAKERLKDDEYEEYQFLMRNPYRILMEDIGRAEGIANLADWERYNEFAQKESAIMQLKMKAKFKDYFTEKENNAPASIIITIGGITLEE